jgi:tRNA 2-selenouridine synthase
MVLSTRIKPTIEIGELFNNRLENYAIIDVRSPSEYLNDNIVTSVNIPLLNDEERKIVGTIYKNDGPFKAKIKALNLIHTRLPEILENIINQSKKEKELIIYCARGGDRSEVIQTLLSLLQIPSVKLHGGYKSYRKSICKFFDLFSLQCITLYGPTGSGKTLILKNLNKEGYFTADLEGCASHKGSSFGYIGEKNFSSITQKKFESKIWYSLYQQNYPKMIFIEGESRRIGKVVIPTKVFFSMSTGIKIYLDMPLKNRVDFIIKEYKPHIYKNEIIKAFNCIEKYIGKTKSLNLLKLLNENRFEEFAELILKTYYDPLYNHSFPPHFDYKLTYNTIEEAVDKLKEIYEKLIK